MHCKVESSELTINEQLQADVIVAGAGPVGAYAAARLAHLKVKVTLLEAAPDCREDLRASTIHPPTLEMFDELGASQTLISQGLKAPEYQYRERSTNRVVAFDLSELADLTRFPYRLQCEQFKVARHFSGSLANNPHGAVHFNHRVVHLEQSENDVTVACETPMEVVKFKAKYLIAADGASSIVRKWLGVPFEGYTYPERFLTLSTDYPVEQHFPGLAYVNYVADPKEWVVMLRVPTLWRVQVPVPAVMSDAEALSDDKMREVFDRLIGDGGKVSTTHRTLFNVHQRVAKKYDHGRVLLVGDAAHLNNPLGGFGMNSGIHDARNLTEKIAAVLNEGADAKQLFDRFNRQRRAVMLNFIQEQTVQNKKMMEGSSEEVGSYGDELAIISNDPERRYEYLLKQAMFQSLTDEQAIQ